MPDGFHANYPGLHVQINLAYTCLSRTSVLISVLPRLNLNVVLLLNWARSWVTMVLWRRSPLIPNDETGSEWLASCTDRFTPWEQGPDIHEMSCVPQSRSEPPQRSLYTDYALAFVRSSRRYCSRCHGHLIVSSFWASKGIKIELCRNIILPIVLYGCETWSVNLRTEHRLRVFENRVLRKIFGPNRNEVTGEWRRLHNE